MRALENFKISGVPLFHYSELIQAIGIVKMAAARANHECGKFSSDILNAIVGAWQELIDEKLHEQFRVGVFQGGAGTFTNMNANEVIANRALELMGKHKGEYKYCDPHDHVNASQSTNDAYPSALHIALALGNRKADRRSATPRGIVSPEGQRIQPYRQDVTHAASRRGPHDVGAGI